MLLYFYLNIIGMNNIQIGTNCSVCIWLVSNNIWLVSNDSDQKFKNK